VRSSPPHWIRHNAAVRVPSRFVFLDTEAIETTEGWDKVQRWRLAVTAADWRPKQGEPWRETQWQVHRDPGELWRWVSNFTRAKRRTILVAHNLAYDLRISDAFGHLSALGWQLSHLSLHDRAVAATWRRRGCSLLLCDSMALLPMALGRIGALVGVKKAPLPDFAAGDDEWVTRCTIDVQILRAAVLDLLTWIEDDELGNWQRTAGGQAWAIWRHRHYTHRVLVHDDASARAAEAEACYTGRTEAWRHGRLRKGPFVSFDLPMAYSTICTELQVPLRLMGHGTRRRLDTVERRPAGVRYLCRAEVSAGVPVLPHHLDGRTLWPVGDFAGWWWDDELLEAHRFGAEVQVLETYRYSAAPALASWAHWVIEASQAQPPGLSPVRAAFAKHLARALVGRFATRFVPWEYDSPADELRETIERVVYPETGKVGTLLTLGSETWQGTDPRYGPDACVFVMSAVMAECRIRLWRIMVAAGLGNVVHCDTDGVIVTSAGAERLAAWLRAGNGWGLRVKATHECIDVLGPRQLVVDGTARISGVPSTAQRVDPDTWAGEVWSTLPDSLRRGEPDAVRISPRSWIVRGVDNRRLHLPDGTTAPITVGRDVAGRLAAAAGR